MAEAIAARALAAPTRRLLRWCFVVFLLLGFAYEVAFPLLFVVHAVVLPQGIATLWAVPYLLAAAALLFGYRRADAELRQRLRWMFWSALVFTVGIQLSNVPVLGWAGENQPKRDSVKRITLGRFCSAGTDKERRWRPT
jgi:hypothetical protein